MLSVSSDRSFSIGRDVRLTVADASLPDSIFCRKAHILSSATNDKQMSAVFLDVTRLALLIFDQMSAKYPILNNRS